MACAMASRTLQQSVYLLAIGFSVLTVFSRPAAVRVFVENHRVVVILQGELDVLAKHSMPRFQSFIHIA